MLKTLDHGLLRGDEVFRSRETHEVEVESVAYIVCDALGLDTSDYSFSYNAHGPITRTRSRRPRSESPTLSARR
jgi:hypothetical protein